MNLNLTQLAEKTGLKRSTLRDRLALWKITPSEYGYGGHGLPMNIFTKGQVSRILEKVKTFPKPKLGRPFGTKDKKPRKRRSKKEEMK